MNTSAAAIGLIKQFEGFPFGGRPYRDAAGAWTIGYGRTAGVRHNSRRLSEREASLLLEQDLRRIHERHVNALPMAGALNQHQFDALVSFVYNLGPGAIAADTGIGRALRAGEWQRAADEMLRWNRAGGSVLEGLTRRREAERALFLRPASESLLDELTPHERRWCLEYDRLVACKRRGRDSAESQLRRAVLRAVLRRRRKAIWHVAETIAGGWERAGRRARYRALRARTT